MRTLEYLGFCVSEIMGRDITDVVLPDGWWIRRLDRWERPNIDERDWVLEYWESKHCKWDVWFSYYWPGQLRKDFCERSDAHELLLQFINANTVIASKIDDV